MEEFKGLIVKWITRTMNVIGRTEASTSFTISFRASKPTPLPLKIKMMFLNLDHKQPAMGGEKSASFLIVLPLKYCGQGLTSCFKVKNFSRKGYGIISLSRFFIALPVPRLVEPWPHSLAMATSSCRAGTGSRSSLFDAVILFCYH